MIKFFAILTILFFGQAAALESVKALDISAQAQTETGALPCEDRGSCEDERQSSESSEEYLSTNQPGPPTVLEQRLSAGFATESMTDRHILFSPLRPPSI